jgi:hypothetical protein
MRVVVSVAIALVASTSSGDDAIAALQMYKCIIGGRTVYQQAACPADADPAASAPVHSAAASASVKPASSAERAAPAAARRLRPPSAKASSVPATPR